MGLRSGACPVVATAEGRATQQGTCPCRPLLPIVLGKEGRTYSIVEGCGFGLFCPRRCLPPSTVSVSVSPSSPGMNPPGWISSLLVPREKKRRPALILLLVSLTKPCFFTPGDYIPAWLGDLVLPGTPRSPSVKRQVGRLSGQSEGWVMSL